MKKIPNLDQTDIDIINILSKEAKTPYAEIGDQLFISGGTVHVRLKKLMEMGVIEGTSLKLNYSKLGLNVTSFIGVYLEKNELYDEVIESLNKIPEILEIHYTTGKYSLFVKLVCRDTMHLREILAESIQTQKGISRTETFISLDEPVHRAPVIEK